MPAITQQTQNETTVFRLTGDLVTEVLHVIDGKIAQLPAISGQTTIDLSDLGAMDTGGAFLIARLRNRLAAQGVDVRITGASADRAKLVDTVAAALFKDEKPTSDRTNLAGLLSNTGEKVVGTGKSAVSLLNFLGLILSRLGRTLVRPKRLRLTALFAQMQQTGLNAVPIIALMGFLIGIVLAYQGAAQLRQFGAEVFVVDLIAVSVLRELGILLTAIIVAGRSGSAFAASIGSMKVNEEIDAMRTLGLDPIEVLVLPRVIALTIMLPLLGLVANVTALTGGGIMSWLELGVSPGMFVTRFLDNTSVWHLAVGMIKAPFFAFVIAMIACWQGLQVGGSAESVGQRTTTAVVQAIFFVIVLDAIFSIFFSEIGI